VAIVESAKPWRNQDAHDNVLDGIGQTDTEKKKSAQEALTHKPDRKGRPHIGRAQTAENQRQRKGSAGKREFRILTSGAGAYGHERENDHVAHNERHRQDRMHRAVP